MRINVVRDENGRGGAGLQSCGGSPDPPLGGTWTSRAGVDACPTM
jgi:hypothetical protein